MIQSPGSGKFRDIRERHGKFMENFIGALLVSPDSMVILLFLI